MPSKIPSKKAAAPKDPGPRARATKAGPVIKGPPPVKAVVVRGRVKPLTRAAKDAPSAGLVPPVPVARPPAGTPKIAAEPVPRDACAIARTTLLQALYKEVGRHGSLLEHPNGQSFTLQPEVAEGALHSQRSLMVPLPKGGSVPHRADLAIELEDGGLIYVDILMASAGLGDLKAAAYDAAMAKLGAATPVAVLVLVRTDLSGLSQELVERVGHGFDYVFGIDEGDVALESKFAACKTEILGRLREVAS